MKFSFYTLGCKVNQFETQAMERLLVERGHRLGAWDETCDLYIVNTCTVTAVSDKKCRNVIRRARREHPNAVIGVCGCFSQIDPGAVRALGADVISGTTGRVAFLDLIERALVERVRLEQLGNALQTHSFEMLPAGALSERTRAMLKVEDGCQNFCAYCIIPYTRGPVRSLPLADAVRQARACETSGYRELVITGIEISSWRQDGFALKDLIVAICDAVPKLRIRLGSLEPRTVTEEFCHALAEKKNLCPHFHVSLQSGSDSVLLRMRRKYDTAQYLESVRLLRQFFPGCGLTTDLIVGFPGETEEEFTQSLTFLQTCGFSDVHVFPYSRRAGTAAAKMPGQLMKRDRDCRVARATRVVTELQTAYRCALSGTRQDVLFEQIEDGLFTGHCENYVKVYVAGEALHNEVRAVLVDVPYRDGVRGTFLPRQISSTRR